MISIVVCSRASFTFDKFASNLNTTIGNIDFEIIRIDNSFNQFSIAKAYNLGIEKSKYNIICCVHEDVEFITVNWGIALIDIFQGVGEVGVVGIAGSKLYMNAPGGWFNYPQEYHVKSVIQVVNGIDKLEEIGFDDDCSLVEVKVLDGVFLAFRKDELYKFPEDLTGFHGYDTALSLEALQRNKKNYVTNTFLIRHYSSGNINHQWFEAMLKVNYLYKDKNLGEGTVLGLQKDLWVKFMHKSLDAGFNDVCVKALKVFYNNYGLNKNLFIILKRLCSSQFKINS